jgi:aminoglycoside phosphotransferase (APT) family kinase protein
MLPDAPADVPPDIRAALIGAFPRFGQARLSIAGRGWHSLAIDIDDRFIAKFPQGAEAESALRREAKLLSAVRPHLTQPVPDMQLVENGPLLFSLHEKLGGEILLRSQYELLPGAARDRLAATLAQFFAELHAIDPGSVRAAGAEPVEWWDVREETLQPVWRQLSADMVGQARAALDAYRSREWSDAVYGFFDAHGWNMAFDHTGQTLSGIFDFADSGFGPALREFVPVSLISPDLTRRTIGQYVALTGRRIETGDIYLMTAAARLSEFAGAMETGEHVGPMRDLVIDWFAQRDVR